MQENILSKLLTECPFPEVFEDTEKVEGSSLPVPRRKIGHIRADYDGWRWYNTVWTCHKTLATPEVCTEIDRVYDALIAPDALKDLAALRKFCADHMDGCIAKEYGDEFSFYYVGERCNFWIRLITRKGDYTGYYKPPAAAAHHTVDACAHDRKDHTYGEHIKYIRGLPLRQLRNEEVEHRHEKNAAKQAHAAGVSAFKKCEELHAANTENRVQQGKQQHEWNSKSKPILCFQQPDHVKNRSDQQKNDQEMILQPWRGPFSQLCISHFSSFSPIYTHI